MGEGQELMGGIEKFSGKANFLNMNLSTSVRVKMYQPNKRPRKFQSWTYINLWGGGGQVY